MVVRPMSLKEAPASRERTEGRGPGAPGSGVTAYDSATGEVRWRTEGLSDALAVDVVDVIVSQTAQGAGHDGSVVALRVEGGSRAWTRLLDEPLAAGGTGPGGVVAYLTSSARPAYDLLDVRTGALAGVRRPRLRWPCRPSSARMRSSAWTAARPSSPGRRWLRTAPRTAGCGGPCP
jgi:hypothetical protein